jgi:quercetin dioxygenase-like cupin family protein
MTLHKEAPMPIKSRAVLIATLAFSSVSGLVQAQGGKPGTRAEMIASVDLGDLPESPRYWHLYHFPNRASAEAAVRDRSTTVIEAFDKIWLYSIAEQGWEPSGGQHVAAIGPLPLKQGRKYTARYIKATFGPGETSVIHSHAGPEAWYLISGTQCLETPDGVTVATAGQSAIVPEGPPMALSSVGPGIRRSVVLVLHDSAQPWMHPSTWKPKDACPK